MAVAVICPAGVLLEEGVMATQKQFAANRANAERSTGPKSLPGRMKSSRNAYRHGLSSPMPIDALASESFETIIHALTDGRSRAEQQQAATEFAQAQLELWRVGQVRHQLIREIDLGNTDPRDLRRLLTLDRYDRFARSAQRRASRKLGRSAQGSLGAANDRI
jgi:hypothetical protein